MSEPGLSVACIGGLVPDTPELDFGVTSRAGILWFGDVVESLNRSGVRIDLILSQRQVALFPRSRHLFFGEAQTSLASGLRIHLVSFLNLPVFRQAWVAARMSWQMIRWARRTRRGGRRPMVLLFNLTEPVGIAILAAARIARAPLVAVMGDVNVPGESVAPTLARRIDFAQQRFTAKRLSGMVAVSAATPRVLAPGIPSITIATAPPSAVVDAFAELPARAGAGVFRLGYFGSLLEVNGVRQLLDAFEILRRIAPEIHASLELVVAGRGPLEGAVREAAAADPRIRYLGYLDHADVLALYGEIDGLVNYRPVSSMDTRFFFPLKLAEYAATGIPTISTRFESLPQGLEGGLLLCDPDTPEALADTIRRLFEMPADERRSLARRAREWVHTEADWRIVGPRLRSFLEALPGQA